MKKEIKERVKEELSEVLNDHIEKEFKKDIEKLPDKYKSIINTAISSCKFIIDSFVWPEYTKSFTATCIYFFSSTPLKKFSCVCPNSIAKTSLAMSNMFFDIDFYFLQLNDSSVILQVLWVVQFS